MHRTISQAWLAARVSALVGALALAPSWAAASPEAVAHTATTVTTTATANAHPEPAPAPAPPTAGEVKALREFKMLDLNGDGQLSRNEVRLFPRLSAAFDEADTNHDGLVSYEEVRALAAKVRAERERARSAQAQVAPGANSPTPP